jgi:anaphase-promoting complex subunit 2
MIKDLFDSHHLESDIQSPFPRFSAKILSAMYWPRLKVATFNPPSPMASALSTYESQFEKLRPKRKIAWVHGEGTVAADIELRDRIVKVDNARPAYLAFIYAFASDDDSKEVTLTQDQLCELLEMEPILVTKAATYWRNKGVLRIEPPNTYSIIETISTSPTSSPTATRTSCGAATHLEQQEEAGSNLSDQERQLYTQYVTTMLTNANKAMKTEEVHSFLNMLLPGGVSVGEKDLGLMMEGMEGIVREGEAWKVRSRTVELG